MFKSTDWLNSIHRLSFSFSIYQSAVRTVERSCHQQGLQILIVISLILEGAKVLTLLEGVYGIQHPVDIYNPTLFFQCCFVRSNYATDSSRVLARPQPAANTTEAEDAKLTSSMTKLNDPDDVYRSVLPPAFEMSTRYKRSLQMSRRAHNIYHLRY
jgi:hypothetical protein